MVVTTEKDSTKKQQKELTEELFKEELLKAKDFLKSVGLIFIYPEREDVVNIFTNKEIIDTIKKYEGEVAREIASNITSAAYYLKDKKAIIEIARIIGKYEGDTAREIAKNIGRASLRLGENKGIIDMGRTKKAIIDMARTIGKYEGEVAEIIANRIGHAAYTLKDEDVIKISKILGMDEIVNTIKKYEGEVAEIIANRIGHAAYTLRDKDEDVIKISKILGMDEIVNTIKKYEGEVAEIIANRIGHAAYTLRDKDEDVIKISKILGMDEIVNTIKKYEGEVARKIAINIAHAAYDLRDSSKIIRIVGMLNKVGKDMFDVLNDNGIYEIINLGLDNLIKNRRDFDAITLYIKSDKKLPLPTENNIDSYLDLAANYVKRKYGIEKNLNYNQLLMFFSTEEKIRKEVVNFVNNSREINPKYYSLSIKNKNNSLNYSRDDLEKYAIIAVIGSRNKDLEKEAVNIISSIVGEKTVNRARNEFYKNYKNLIKEIASAFNQGNYEKAINILKQTNNEAINDVINSVNYRDININSNVIKAVESKNPLDYDNRVQMACVYLPYGSNIEDGILKYCKDNRIKLVRYDIGDQPLGSAICYLEDKKLLVDSVEGHRRFRKEEIFEIVYNDLIERAKEWGAEVVVFSKNTLNETSRKFLEYLSSKNLKYDEVEMKLNTSAYIEAERPVKGYVVRVKIQNR